MNKLESIIPGNSLISYNSLILLHLNCGTLAWGYNFKRIDKLHKEAVRIITNSPYFAHTDIIFQNLHILKIKDVFGSKTLTFYDKLKHQKLPEYFCNFKYIADAQIHIYYTRTRHHIRPLTKMNCVENV